jgi:hypothetical protein
MDGTRRLEGSLITRHYLLDRRGGFAIEAGQLVFVVAREYPFASVNVTAPLVPTPAKRPRVLGAVSDAVLAVHARSIGLAEDR